MHLRLRVLRHGPPDPMTTAATSATLESLERPPALGAGAQGYLLAVTVAAAAAAGPLYLRAQDVGGHWGTFAVIAAAAALAQAFPVASPRNVQYHTSVVFLVAGALLLPPELLVLVPLAQTLPEWLRDRHPWHVQLFNVGQTTLGALAAWGTAHLVRVHGGALLADQDARFALAGLTACLAFVAANHALVAAHIRFTSGRPWRETRLLSTESLSTDLVLTLLGVTVAAFWQWDAWLIPAALAPLIVVHRSLSVPQLQAEARVDPKTGLYNARYFASALAAEIARARRFSRPLSLVMADLDLLREVNNNYGHLAGDAVLQGIAEIFRSQLRHYDVPARFGGEEFSILLPETTPEQAFEMAERIRKAVSARRFEVETAGEPIGVTVSIGVASLPNDGVDANELIHQADLAVYRAKLQGRNRVLSASKEPLLLGSGRASRLQAVREDIGRVEPSASATRDRPAHERRRPRPHAPVFFALTRRLGPLVGAVGAVGVAAGTSGLLLGHATDAVGLLAAVALAGGGQALSFELAEMDGTLSVGAVGSLAGLALFDYRAALPLAVVVAVVEWSSRRHSAHQALFNIGALSLAGMAAAAVFHVHPMHGRLVPATLGIVAGIVYFVVNMTLISLASAIEGRENPWQVFRERFAWLLPHYAVYGFIATVTAIAYHAVGLYALAVFAVPMLLMRKTQEAYLRHTQRSAQKLRAAAETIQSQNVSLEEANRLLRERTTAAMESLSATVDARDSYTAGHSRRVQQIALAIGDELGLSKAELDLLGHAALFHDIGKLAIPDSILLKPGLLSGGEWELMQTHAEEGARIIERLGFLQDAVPAIRHHHERFDGGGYPQGLAGEEIPLGARIIHVADALDSMLTTRIYRAARPLPEALAELRLARGNQFCPRCVDALERLLPLEAPLLPEPGGLRLVASA